MKRVEGMKGIKGKNTTAMYNRRRRVSFCTCLAQKAARAAAPQAATRPRTPETVRWDAALLLGEGEAEPEVELEDAEALPVFEPEAEAELEAELAATLEVGAGAAKSRVHQSQCNEE